MRHLLGVSVALTAACAGGEISTPTNTTADSAGIAVVTSYRSVWGERSAHVDSNPVLRIGAEQPGPYQFSFVSMAILLKGGGIAAVEAMTNEVRLFDAQGQHIRSVGRRGRGPGEFQTITGLFRTSGDSLSTYDQVERRATVFPVAAGEPRVVRSVAVPGGRGMLAAFGAFGDGRILLYNPGSGFRPDLAPGLQWVTSEVVALDPTDGATEILAQLPSRQQLVVEGGDTKVHAPAHGAIRAATGNGFYWGTSDRYEIRFFDTEGTLQRILRRPIEPRLVEPAMIDAWMNANLDDVRRREGESAVPRYREIYEAASHGDRLPLFDRAFVDGDDRLWVGSAVWPEQRSAPSEWSVFAPNGVWLGDVVAPPQLRILDVRDGLVLGVWQEDGEAPYVQVHRLRRP